MIKSFEIENVLSHKHSLLEFHPNFNVIVGLTDSGKSAIMQAIRWVKDNRPIGIEEKDKKTETESYTLAGFRSKWGGVTRVRIDFTEGTFVIRSKDVTNQYEISGLDDHLNAFNKDVPDEVKQIINMDETNIQYQLDSHFLLSKTGGEVAAYFNKVAGIDKIDLAQKNITSWIRKIKQEGDFKEKDLLKYEKELEHYDSLQQFELDVENLELLEHQKIIKAKKLTTLEGILEEMIRINKELPKLDKILEVEGDIDEVLALIEQRDSLALKIKKMIVLGKVIRDTKNEIQLIDEFLENEELVDTTIKLVNKAEELNKSIKKMNDLYTQITSLNKQIQETTDLFIDLHDQFETNFPNQCPLCGKPK